MQTNTVKNSDGVLIIYIFSWEAPKNISKCLELTIGDLY
jgi:hypothetical protein